jgi:hypothetical protein
MIKNAKFAKLQNSRLMYLFCISVFTYILCLACPNMCAQGSAGALAPYESQYIVDMPTAGMIPRGQYRMHLLMQPNGNPLFSLQAAPTAWLMAGISYSAANLIGAGPVEVPDYPAVEIKARIWDETVYRPAIVAGFSMQGRGIWMQERYQTLQPGLYAAFSKNFRWALGTLALHGGINYAVLPAAPMAQPNFWIGAEQSMGNRMALSLEYNATMNDNAGFMSKKGLLNAALRYSPARAITIEFMARDLLRHIKGNAGFGRSVGIEYFYKW